MTTYKSATWIAVLLLSACHVEPPAPASSETLPSVRVETYLAEARGLDAHEQVVGTVRARVRATLEAKVPGRIRKLPVSVGDEVRPGQIVAELDAKEIRANLAKALAVLKQTTAEKARYSKLLEKRSVTPAEYETVEARHSVAIATVNEARTVLGYARVTAPFAGVVTHKMAEVGDLAKPGRPIIEINDLGTLRFEAAVPETLSRFVGLGAQVPVRISPVSETLDAVVSEVAPSADPNSRTLLVKLDLPSNPELRAGQFGRALVPTGRQSVIRIPTSAIVRRGQLELVFVATDQRAELRLVKTGKVFDDQTEIVSGIESGERVVTTEPRSLRDGQPIEASR